MKRDFEIIKNVLAHIESLPQNECINLDSDEDPELVYHYELLKQKGLIEWKFSRAMGDPEVGVYVNMITWEGHDFLDDAKNDTAWRKTMEMVKEKGGAVSFEIFKAVLNEAVKASFRMGSI